MSELIKCSCCGEMLPANQIELTFGLPDVIFAIPEKEREERADGNSDVYVLDDDRFFVRGLIPLTVDNQQEYCLGAWAEISETDFDRISELWDEDSGPEEPRFKGKLSNSIPYTYSEGQVELEIQLQDSDTRPLFYITSKSCSLYEEQTKGINAHRAFEFTNYPRKDRFSVFEEDELESKPCSCCESDIKLYCGSVENTLGTIEADYWLRIPTGHPNKFTIAIAISKDAYPRVAVLYSEIKDGNLSYWIQSVENSPWEHFGDYGKVIGREAVLKDKYKAFYFDIVDAIAANDTRLKQHIGRD